MKKIATICAVLLVGFASNAFACASPACKRIQNSKDIPDNIKQEILNYYDRQEEVRKDCTAKQRQLRDVLSPEAREMMRTQGRKSLKKRRSAYNSEVGSYQNNNNPSR